MLLLQFNDHRRIIDRKAPVTRGLAKMSHRLLSGMNSSGDPLIHSRYINENENHAQVYKQVSDQAVNCKNPCSRKKSHHDPVIGIKTAHLCIKFPNGIYGCGESEPGGSQNRMPLFNGPESSHFACESDQFPRQSEEGTATMSASPDVQMLLLDTGSHNRSIWHLQFQFPAC